MAHNNNADLSTIFRRPLNTASQEGMHFKQELLNQQYSKAESRASAFLLDSKYVLKLDELI